MPQTSYPLQPAPGIPGLLGDSGRNRIASRVNLNAAAQPCGIFMKESTASFPNGADVMGAATDVIAGIVAKSDAHAITNTTTGILAIDNQEIFDCVEVGAVWMRAEQVLVASDPVFVRFAANGGNTILGAIRKDVDSGNARRVNGARVIKSGVSAPTVASPNGVQMSLVYFDKATEQNRADIVDIPIATPSTAATLTTHLTKTRADGYFVVTGVDYIEPATGIAQSDTNFYVLTIQVGATVIGTFSTKLTGGNGPITANAFAAFVMGVLANTVVPPGSVIDFVETLTGALTAPAGQIVLHGFYI